MSSLRSARFSFGPHTYEIVGTPFTLHNPGRFNAWEVQRNGVRDEHLTRSLPEKDIPTQGGEAIDTWLRQVHEDEKPRTFKAEVEAYEVYNVAAQPFDSKIGNETGLRKAIATFANSFASTRRLRVTIEEIKG